MICFYVRAIEEIPSDNTIFCEHDIPAGKNLKNGFHNLLNITTKNDFSHLTTNVVHM